MGRFSTVQNEGAGARRSQRYASQTQGSKGA